MKTRLGIVIYLLLLLVRPADALQPEQILIIANSDISESVQLAQYYCAKRAVPLGNILALPLGASLREEISRDSYERQLARPIFSELFTLEFAGKIRCLLTTYGVPTKIGKREPLKGQEDHLRRLTELVNQRKNMINQLGQSSSPYSAAMKEKINRELDQLQFRIDHITGRETDASVDSELSMLMFGDYELCRWQPNNLKNNNLLFDFKTLMVCRLDGPGFQIARGLIDKAISAEKTGLKGIAYIDSRGIADDKNPYSFGHYDQSLRDLATLIKTQTQMPVIEERTGALFAPGQCPSTALYCGWYSLQKYVDAFDFVDGAIGYHISSWEAITLRDPNSSQWCPAMLKDGITATLGAVSEPYLHSFPEPKEFFQELLKGRCLVEAFYFTNPFNSWQMVLIGDPLYSPFRKSQGALGGDF